MPGLSKKYTREYLTSPEGIEEVRHLIGVEHCTLEELARTFGIAVCTVHEWAKKYPEFQEALKSGAVVRNQLIEHNAYDMCFPHRKTQKFIEKDAEGNIIKATIKEETVDPSFQFVQFVLTNQMKDKWRSKQEVSFADDTKLTVFVDDIGMFNNTENINGNTSKNDEETSSNINTQSKDKVANNGKSVQAKGNRKKKDLLKALDEF